MVSATPSGRESTLLALVRGAVIGIATAVALQLTSDPDLWGHLRYGEDWLSTLTVPSSDVYSFTSDRLWINHEWLTEALFASAYRAGGTIALAILNAAIVLAARGPPPWSSLSHWPRCPRRLDPRRSHRCCLPLCWRSYARSTAAGIERLLRCR